MTTAPQVFVPAAVRPMQAIHVTGRRVVATIMATGIKVVAEATGQAPGIAAGLVRTLLRIIDGLLAYTVAYVTVLASAKRQRLGDMAARTLVVHT